MAAIIELCHAGTTQDGVRVHAPPDEALKMRGLDGIACLLAEHPRQAWNVTANILALATVTGVSMWLAGVGKDQGKKQHTAAAPPSVPMMTPRTQREPAGRTARQDDPEHLPRRRKLSIPKVLRREVTEHVRSIARQYRDQFRADRELKNRLLRLALALLPSRPRRRGRPRNPIVSRAIAMYGRLRRKFPEDRPRAKWRHRVCPRAIPGYAGVSEMEQRDACDQLRERVSWRRRKIPAETAV